MEYSAGNIQAPGYTGCVSEDDATPCGWYDYHSYDAATNTCSQTATKQTAIQTVRGGSPTMTADMIRLTGEETLPTITFPALPMAYPTVRSDPTAPELGEANYKFQQFMTYFGSQLDLSGMTGFVDYGAEQGMVLSIATKVLELARTTCTRQFYAFLEAPAYGYDWSQAVAWVDTRASSFYNGAECTCHATSTCQSSGVITISQRGWAPARLPALPTENGDDGVAYTPASTSPNSPWFQTNVIPGNPIGRFGPCQTPTDRCLCDGVYWYPGFIAPTASLSHIGCYSWAFSITKIYSAQMRAGMFYVSTQADALSAAQSILGKALSIANGLVSYMQLHGQIQIMDKIMEKPFSDPTSWLHAMALAQYEKWDVMHTAFGVCEAAGIVKITAEQPKYFGAYIFSHMMPEFQGYSANIGRASSDFFMSVVGYDHFNYYWGWRGEAPTAYGNGVGANITNQDFHRIHTFRAYAVYAEEARRMTLVCGNRDAKVSSSLLSVNEWKALRQADLRRRRARKLSDASHEAFSLHERALLVQQTAPKMKLVDAIKYAESTDPGRKPDAGEYGLPHDQAELDRF